MITVQQVSHIKSLLTERSQMEDEIRDIYDKRESVAQWEAQISEIIKWYVVCFENMLIFLLLSYFLCNVHMDNVLEFCFLSLFCMQGVY